MNAQTRFQVTSVLDDGKLLDYVHKMNAPERGVISVLVRPNARRSAWVGSDIVSALGKEGTVDHQRGTNDAFAFAQAWLLAEGITDVVFSGAQCLRVADLRQVLQLCVFAQLRIWLVFDSEMPEALYRLLANWDVDEIPPSDFRQLFENLLPEETCVDDCDAEAQPFPETPSDGFLTFYAEAQRELGLEEFASVEAAYRRGFEAASTWSFEESNCEEEIATHMHDLTAKATGTSEVLTLVRGVQAASFRRGVFIKVKLQRFIAQAEQARSVSDLSTVEWKRLGRYTRPWVAAVGTLTALGLDTRQIAELQSSRVAIDGSTIDMGGEKIQVPEGARNYLIAQHLLRLAGGNRADGGFIDAGERSSPPTVRGIARKLTELTRLTGIAFRIRNEPMDTTKRGWANRWGVSVQPLNA